ncbi:MAG TPA: hypothetical protein VGS41_05785 [Chthonomonadales bacterium]|nr:hypothetical protein [Chthonomonadales bacterium]
MALMEELLDLCTGRSESIPFRLIQPGKEAWPPLFIFCATAGEEAESEELCRYLDPARPVYLVRADPPGQWTPELLILTGEAAAHRARDLQDRPPFLLAGLRDAGLVAFETAQTLAAEGLKVGLLALVETACPNPAAPGRLALPRGRILKELDRRLGLRIMPGSRSYRGRSGRRKTSPAYQNSVMERYRARPYPGSITLITARLTPDRTAWNPRLRWSDVAMGGFEIVTYPGNGELEFSGQTASDAGARLQACIDRSLR